MRTQSAPTSGAAQPGGDRWPGSRGGRRAVPGDRLRRRDLARPPDAGGTRAGCRATPTSSQLPGVPDAAFVAVSREATVKVVAELARLGAGGVVCHASGFAEDGRVRRRAPARPRDRRRRDGARGAELSGPDQLPRRRRALAGAAGRFARRHRRGGDHAERQHRREPHHAAAVAADRPAGDDRQQRRDRGGRPDRGAAGRFPGHGDRAVSRGDPRRRRLLEGGHRGAATTGADRGPEGGVLRSSVPGPRSVTRAHWPGPTYASAPCSNGSGSPGSARSRRSSRP